MEAIIVIIVIVIIVLAGPRVKIDTSIRTPDLPQDLDAYIEKSEKAIPGIRPDTEKKIFWSGKKGEKTRLSLVYVHGYSATRMEASPVIERAGEALGANVFFTRLKGHGLDSEAMGTATINDWCNDVWEAYEIGRRIGEKVIMVGFSTGAPLVMWLAGKKPEALAGLVMMSANFAPADKASFLILAPWGPVLVRLIVGKYHRFAPVTQVQEKYWTLVHRSESLLPMAAACRLGRSVKPEDVTIPVLAFYTETDKLVSLPVMKKIYGRLGSTKKKLVNIENATDHILTGDAVSPQTTGRVTNDLVSFIKESILL